MKRITGIIGRDELVADVVREIRKGKHMLLTGPIGIGKSVILEAAIYRIERRKAERWELDPLTAGTPFLNLERLQGTDRRQERELTLVYLHEHQAKGQFVSMARRLLGAGIVKPSALDLPKGLDQTPPGEIEWAAIRRQVNRLSVRDLSGAIIPAIHAHEGKIIIAVDDMTSLTPTQQAFWLALLDQSQVITCAAEKKKGVRKLWWRMKEIEVPPLPPEISTEIVRTYITRKGVLIESPDLYPNFRNSPSQTINFSHLTHLTD